MLINTLFLILLPVALAFPSNIIVKSVSEDKCGDVLEACNNIQTAQSCKAIQPCIHIWEKLKAPEDNNEICDLCKDMVKQARDQLLSNETQEEIKEVFEGSCNLIPIKALAAECRNVVDQLIPTLIETLASRMDPTMVCTVAGLCNNGQVASIMKRQLDTSELAPLLIKAVIKNDKCYECESAMTFVMKIIKHIGLDSLTQLSFEACQENFKGTTAQCEIIVRDVIPVIYYYLNVMDPSVFCGAMQSCPVKYPLVKSVGDELTCEFCETLVQYVKNTFTSATTKEEFRTAFTNMCKDLREFSPECSSLVNEYFDQFYDFIVGQMEPKLVCSALGLCDKALPVPKVTEMVQLLPAKVNPQVDIYPAIAVLKQVSRVGLRVIDTHPRQEESRPGIQIHLPMLSKKTNHFTTKEDTDTNRIIVDEIVPTMEDTDSNRIDVYEKLNPEFQQLPVERYFYPSIVAKNDMACTLCKTIVNFLDQELQDKKTEDAIRQALDRVCAYLPKELDAQCIDFVNEYTELIVNLLLQEFTPDSLCSLLKVCPADDNTFKAIPIQTNGVFCEVCVKVMQYVEKELETNTTEEAIKEALDKACSYLPKSYAVKCQNFMDQYAEMIFELLSKEIAPRAVCTMLGVCPFAPKNNGDLQCQICQYTLHYIQDLLMNNATVEEIKQGLEKACEELPQKIASECKNYIEQYGDAILALLAQKIDPSVICIKLNICPGRQNRIQSTSVVQNLKIDTCGTCQVVVDYMDKLLENDDIDREITKLVEKVCTIVPKTTRDQCVTIIEAYGPYILQMIGQLADSKEVCQTIDLCARVPGHVHLLGGGKCTFGPTYWCQSSAHAAACKAQLYCKQKMWGQ